MAIAVFRSLLPATVAFRLTTHEEWERWVHDFIRATQEHPDHVVLWPLLIGAWKRKEQNV